MRDKPHHLSFSRTCALHNSLLLDDIRANTFAYNLRSKNILLKTTFQKMELERVKLHLTFGTWCVLSQILEMAVSIFTQKDQSGLWFQREVFAYNIKNKLKALGHVMLGGKFHQQHDRALWKGCSLAVTSKK